MNNVRAEAIAAALRDAPLQSIVTPRRVGPLIHVKATRKVVRGRTYPVRAHRRLRPAK